MLLRAVASLIDHQPDLRSRLVVPIVGGPSGTGLEHPEALADLAAELRHRRLVRFVPPVPPAELAVWDAAASVVAVPSYNESFGLVAAEAQASGTPVVAADGGRPEHRRRRRCERTAPGHPRAVGLGSRASAGSCSTTACARGSPPAPAREPGCSRGRTPRSARSTSTNALARACARPSSHVAGHAWQGRGHERPGPGAARLPDRQRAGVRRARRLLQLRAPRRAQAPDAGPPRRRHPRPRRPRVRLPQPGREPRARLPLAPRAQPQDVRRVLRRRHPRRHLPRRAAAPRPGHPRGARPADGLGPRARRRTASTRSSSSASPPRSARSGSGATSAASRPATSRRSAAGWRPARRRTPTPPSLAAWSGPSSTSASGAARSSCAEPPTPTSRSCSRSSRTTSR